MTKLIYFIGIMFCIIISCLIAAEVAEATAQKSTDKWSYSFYIMTVLLTFLTVWGYHSMVFKYFMEIEPMVKIKTGLKFK